MKQPERSALDHPVADGVRALPGGFALLDASRTLLCADAHFGYEDVLGGALPLWSTAEIATSIAIVAQRHAVREIVFLGDMLHGSEMSDGAGRTIRTALAGLAEIAAVTFVAGNHEGRTRGKDVLGETVEACERDGWLLIHGDKPPVPGTRAIIGHLHPSIHLGGDATVPAFVAARSLVVVPALTPYSPGLGVLSDECLEALAPYNVRGPDLHVVAATSERVYPFGTLSRLREALREPTAQSRPNRFRRRYLRGDGT